jgi:uncharacterized protein (TIGR02444 family)
MTVPENPFWDFSLAVYGRQGVAPACIGLQDRLGVDVNVLLFCCFAACRRRKPLIESEIRRALDTVTPWQDGVVRPLRALRTDLKADPAGAPRAAAESLRRHILAAELEAERVEQMLLFELFRESVGNTPPPSLARAVAEKNFSLYFKVLGLAIEESDRASLDVLLTAALAREEDT